VFLSKFLYKFKRRDENQIICILIPFATLKGTKVTSLKIRLFLTIK